MPLSRRRFLKIAAAAGMGFAAYAVLDGLGFLGANTPIQSYLKSREKEVLSLEAKKYGDDGDRIAYALNYLGLPPASISQVVDSWKSIPKEAQNYIGGSVPTATAAIVADELANGGTTAYAHQFPTMLWVHAHTNALFTFPFMPYVQDGDARLVKMADLRLSEGPVAVGNQLLDLYYPETDPNNPGRYGKKKYIREGFLFLAGTMGPQLEGMDIPDMSIVTEQSTSASVTIQYKGTQNGLSVNSGDTFIFFDTAEVPLYCLTAVDNSVALGGEVVNGALSLGLSTMKAFRDRHPGLFDSPSLTLTQQGYVILDDVFKGDPEFQKYLGQSIYGRYLSIAPVERTVAWKMYQTASVVPEQTVRGLGVATIADFHPANFQPLSMLKADPSIVELLVTSPEVYVPSQWNHGHLFQPYP